MRLPGLSPVVEAKEVRRLPAAECGHIPDWFLGVLGGVPGNTPVTDDVPKLTTEVGRDTRDWLGDIGRCGAVTRVCKLNRREGDDKALAAEEELISLDSL